MIKLKLISYINILIVVVLFSVPSFIMAQGPGIGGSGGESTANLNNPLVNCDSIEKCNWEEFKVTINKVKNFAFELAVLLSVIFIVYAGGMYLTAQGDSGKISRAHAILSNVVIGFFLAAAGWLIIHTILNTLETPKTFRPGGL